VARVWVKGEAVVTAQVEYDDETPFLLSQLFPTGRVTSDDWVELESPPFSAEAARGPHGSLGFFSPNGALADAFEVVPAGDFRPNHACTGLADTASCGPDEICLSRHCYDARGFVPSMPTAQKDRDDLADYLENRLRFLFGPYDNRHVHMPQAIARLDEMRTTQSRYRFWFSFISAIQGLTDSHSSAFGLFQFTYGQNHVAGRTPLNVCFLGGDADLSHDQAASQAQLPDVLVSHTGQGATWGLKPGDRLVSIDGVHPVVWARALQGRSWSYESVNDPSSPAQAIESLPGQIASLARQIEVIRCDQGACGNVELIDVASQIPDTKNLVRVACDNRPMGHVPGYPDNHDVGQNAFAGVVQDSLPGEEIYGLTWDSLDGASGGLQPKINAAVSSWRKGARGVILDHRTGNGGTKDTAMTMLGFVTKPRFSEVQIWRSRLDDEGPLSTAEGLKLFELNKDTVGALALVGSSSAVLDVPVALLVTRDVSASDYFPNAFKGSPSARIFGPHPTNGAFSTFLGGSYWLGISYQFAVEDTIDHTGHALCGHGVIPDEIVAPKQSDLMVGVDTVYKAALTWVRSHLKPAEMAQ
jgi:hypothetical protein